MIRRPRKCRNSKQLCEEARVSAYHPASFTSRIVRRSSGQRLRIIAQPVSRSAFLAESNSTPAAQNSSAIDPAPCPVLEKQASSATPSGRTFQKPHISFTCSASTGTV